VKSKSKSLTVQVEALEPLPEPKPEATAATIKSAFISADPARSAVFERMLLEAQARLAVAHYLRALQE